MLFSSTTFLFAFLPLTLLLVFPLPRAWQNSALLALSVCFYLWGTGWQIIWILVVAIFSWASALTINKHWFSSTKIYFAFCVAVCLSPLIMLKYLPPISTIWSPHSLFALAIPLGISFFTFHALSYMIDVKKGKIQADRRADHYFLYLFYFPHQIAGPIVRYDEIVGDIKMRPHPRKQDVVLGLSRFGWGLAKKQLIADPAGAIANGVWASQALGSSFPTQSAWLGALAFAVQIYFDFSAYSDMAIGLARIFGFHFPENFNSPYASISATEFWRRWHMTLSRWFRDYVYIPFGGSRHGLLREYAALLLTFALTSIWHGATFPYLVWGGLWSLALIVERITGLNKSLKFSRARRIAMLLFIVVSWVFFRSPTIDSAVQMLGSMFSWNTLLPSPLVLVTLTPLSVFALVVGILYMVRPKRLSTRVFATVTGWRDGGDIPVIRTASVGALAFGIGAVAGLMSTSTPFLYFQF